MSFRPVKFSQKNNEKFDKNKVEISQKILALSEYMNFNRNFPTLSNKEFMKKQTYWTVVAVIDSWQVFGPLLLGTGSEDYVRRGYELKNK